LLVATRDTWKPTDDIHDTIADIECLFVDTPRGIYRQIPIWKPVSILFVFTPWNITTHQLALTGTQANRLEQIAPNPYPIVQNTHIHQRYLKLSMGNNLRYSIKMDILVSNMQREYIMAANVQISKKVGENLSALTSHKCLP
jgi:hypothetical protein